MYTNNAYDMAIGPTIRLVGSVVTVFAGAILCYQWYDKGSDMTQVVDADATGVSDGVDEVKSALGTW